MGKVSTVASRTWQSAAPRLRNAEQMVAGCVSFAQAFTPYCVAPVRLHTRGCSLASGFWCFKSIKQAPCGVCSSAERYVRSDATSLHQPQAPELKALGSLIR